MQLLVRACRVTLGIEYKLVYILANVFACMHVHDKLENSVLAALLHVHLVTDTHYIAPVVVLCCLY